MKIFKNKFLVKLIASICLFLTILSFGMVNKVQAEPPSDEEQELWGGELINPIVRLITGLGDGIMDLLHQAILSQDLALVKIDGSTFGMKLIQWFLAAVAAVIVIVVAATGVGALVEIGIMSVAIGVKVMLGAVVAGAITGVVVGEKIESEWIPNDVYLPLYKFTPEEIFSNEIVLFDINFFNPMPDKEVTKYGESSVEGGRIIAIKLESWRQLDEVKYFNYEQEVEPFYEKELTDEEIQEWYMIRNNYCKDTKYIDIYSPWYASMYSEDVDTYEKTVGVLREYIIPDLMNSWNSDVYENLKAGDELESVLKEVQRNSGFAEEKFNAATINTPTSHENLYYNSSDEEIPSSDVENEDMRCIGGSEIPISINNDEARIVIVFIANKGTEIQVDETILQSTAKQLKDVVSTWYFILRNLALLVLMLVLIYTGIKIVTGSTAGEKAKYKERLMDWLVAICLVFIMHYIMVFAVELNEKIIELVKSSTNPGRVVQLVGLGDKDSTKFKNANKMEEVNQYIVDESGTKLGGGEGQADKQYYVMWETDLMGAMRINAQESKEGTATWVGAGICYLTLVAYTCFFAWTYLRRVVYMTFLTMIAPLVAMTYPIDKMTDGKAQAFNAWLKEYIFNLLIQPMHLILYTILISSAYGLAGTNILYSLVAMGFMMPAEKLIRRFFGFEKAQTPGALGGAAGAALAMGGMQSLMRFGQHGGNQAGGNSEKEESSKVKYSSSEGVSAMEVMTRDAKNSGGTREGQSQTVTAFDTQQPEQEGLQELEANGEDYNSDINYADMQQGEQMHMNFDNMQQNYNPEQSYMDFEEGADESFKDVKQSNIGQHNMLSGSNILNQPDMEESSNIKMSNSPYGENHSDEDNIDSSVNSTKVSNEKNVNSASKPNAISQPNIDLPQLSADEDEKETEEKDKNNRIARRALRVIGGVSGAYARGMGNKALKRIKRGRPIRSLLRGIAGIAGGMAFGMAGLAIGIASGDPNQVFKNTTAGAFGGYQAGKGVASKAVNTLSVDSEKIKDEAELVWYGDKYKKVKLDEAKKEVLKNEEYITYIRKVTGVSREKAKEILETTGSKCLDSGIRNIDDIIAVHKLKEELVNDEYITYIRNVTGVSEEKAREILAEAGKKNSDFKIEDIDNVIAEYKAKGKLSKGTKVSDNDKLIIDGKDINIDEKIKMAREDIITDAENVQEDEFMVEEEQAREEQQQEEAEEQAREEQQQEEAEEQAREEQQQEEAEEQQEENETNRQSFEEVSTDYYKRPEGDIRKNALEQAIAFKKLSDRLPSDIDKMGAKKIEAHRKQFKNELEDKLQKQIKGDLVRKIQTTSGNQIRQNIIKKMREKGQDTTTAAAKERIKRMMESQINALADKQIQDKAEETSQEIIKGIIKFADTKSRLTDI